MKFFHLLSLLLIPFHCFSSDTTRVLHYTETSGYDHNTRSQSLAMFTAFMDSMELFTGEVWELVHDNDGSEFDDLSRFDVVVFSNTSGNSLLTQQQRSNFEAWITAGGSVIGIHAASDTYRHSSANGGKTGTWDYFAELIGASVQNSPNHTSSSKIGTIHIWSTIYSSGLPYLWIKEEEFYYWENGYLAPGFTEIAQVQSTGSNSYDAPRMVAHYRDLPGGGKSFYTSLGHKSSNFSHFDDPQKDFYFFGVLILNALEATVPAPVFGIFETEPETEPQLEPDGFFNMGGEPGVYHIYDIFGAEITSGEYDHRGVPLLNRSGIFLYKAGGKVWRSAVLSN